MITIVQKPNKYTPADNPVLFQFESDNPDIVYFKLEVLEATTEYTISRLEPTTSPFYLNGSYQDIGMILSNFVKWQIKNDTTEKFYLCPNEILKYKVRITERGYVDGVMSDLDAPYESTDDFYVWNANFERFSFDNQAFKNYILESGSQKHFLTYKPDRTVVNQYSFEQLFFLHDSETTLYAQIQCYPTSLGYFATPLTDEDTNHIYAVNVSPKALVDAYSVDLSTLEYYTVSISSLSGVISKTRTYIYKPLPCHLEPINIIWENSLGGMDSYTFINPQETLNVTRTNIKKYPYRITDGIYSNKSDGNYNVTDEIINSTPVITVKAWTQILSDAEVSWLSEMVKSKQLFVELSDRTLVPINLVNTSYNYQRTKYLQGNVNNMQFEFTFSENIIPALSDAGYVLSKLYYNDEITRWYTKECDFGSQAASIPFTVPAGTYSSNISQTAANNLAIAYLEANGQAYADEHGFCEYIPTYGNEELTVSVWKNDCLEGYYGEFVDYTVPADTYFAYTQEEANALAQADADENSQNYANVNGSCIAGYGNQPYIQGFYKNDCPDGYVGTLVSYIVPANTFFASTQEDANAAAVADASSNGQAYANAHGSCQIAIPDIHITALTSSYPNGGQDTVLAFCTSSQPVQHNIQIQWHAVDTVGGGLYALPNKTMTSGSSSTTNQYVCDVVSGHGSEIQAVITNIIVPPGGPVVNYTF